MNNALLLSSILLWIVVLFNLLLTVALIRRGNATQSGFEMENVETLEIGSQAPDFTAETLDGEIVTLSNFFRGPVVFVFISPFCSPCIENIPKLNILGEKAKKSGAKLVLVNVTSKADTKILVQKHNIKLPILTAPQDTNRFTDDYRARGTPFYCLIDSEGKVASTGFLDSTWEKLTTQWIVASSATNKV